MSQENGAVHLLATASDVAIAVRKPSGDGLGRGDRTAIWRVWRGENARRPPFLAQAKALTSNRVPEAFHVKHNANH
jgi:hypothetical protein